MARKARWLVQASMAGCMPESNDAYTNRAMARLGMAETVASWIDAHSTTWEGDTEVPNPHFSVTRYTDCVDITYSQYGGGVRVSLVDVRGHGYDLADYEW